MAELSEKEVEFLNDQLRVRAKPREWVKKFHYASTNYNRRLKKTIAEIEVTEAHDIPVDVIREELGEIEDRVSRASTKKRRTEAWSKGYTQLGKLQKFMVHLQDEVLENGLDSVLEKAASYSSSSYSASSSSGSSGSSASSSVLVTIASSSAASSSAASSSAASSSAASSSAASSSAASSSAASSSAASSSASSGSSSSSLHPFERQAVLDEESGDYVYHLESNSLCTSESADSQAVVTVTLMVSAPLTEPRIEAIKQKIFRSESDHEAAISKMLKDARKVIKSQKKKAKKSKKAKKKAALRIIEVSANVESQVTKILGKFAEEANSIAESELEKLAKKKTLLRQSRVKAAGRVGKNVLLLASGILKLVVSLGTWAPAYADCLKALKGLGKEVWQQIKREEGLRRQFNKQIRDYITFIEKTEGLKNKRGVTSKIKKAWHKKRKDNSDALTTSRSRYRENLYKFEQSIVKQMAEEAKLFAAMAEDRDAPRIRELRESILASEEFLQNRMGYFSAMNELLDERGFETGDLDLTWVDKAKRFKPTDGKATAKNVVDGLKTAASGIKSAMEIAAG